MYDHLSKLPTTVKICRITQGVGERAHSWLEQLTDPVVSLCVFFPRSWIQWYSLSPVPQIYPSYTNVIFYLPSLQLPLGKLVEKEANFL